MQTACPKHAVPNVIILQAENAADDDGL